MDVREKKNLQQNCQRKESVAGEHKQETAKKKRKKKASYKSVPAHSALLSCIPNFSLAKVGERGDLANPAEHDGQTARETASAPNFDAVKCCSMAFNKVECWWKERKRPRIAVASGDSSCLLILGFCYRGKPHPVTVS